MRAVNLLPADHRGARQAPVLPALSKRSWLAGSGAVAFVLLGAVVGSLLMASSTVSSRTKALQRLDEQIANLPKPKAVPGAATLSSRQSTVTSLASQRTNWDDFLLAVSKVTPEDVWVLSMQADASSAAVTNASGAPTAFSLTGYTYSQPSVARLMRRLALVPWLQNVTLTTSAKAALDNHRVYQFTVGATVVPLPEVGS
jgi:Tfp pilus assembly protein PilN